MNRKIYHGTEAERAGPGVLILFWGRENEPKSEPVGLNWGSEIGEHDWWSYAPKLSDYTIMEG